PVGLGAKRVRGRGGTRRESVSSSIIAVAEWMQSARRVQVRARGILPHHPKPAPARSPATICRQTSCTHPQGRPPAHLLTRGILVATVAPRSGVPRAPAPNQCNQEACCMKRMLKAAVAFAAVGVL